MSLSDIRIDWKKKTFINDSLLTRITMKDGTYLKPNYLDSLADALIERIGYDETRRRFQEHAEQMRLGDTEDCVPVHNAALYLDNSLKGEKRIDLENHVLACNECGEAISRAVQDEIERERAMLTTYVYAMGLTQVISGLDKGSGRLAEQFPLFRKYRGRILACDMTDLK